MFSAWRIRVWRNRRKSRQSPSSQVDTSAMEKGYSEKQLAFGGDNWITAAAYAKPHQPVLVPIIPTDSSVRWQPQIRSVSSSDIPPPLAANNELVSPPLPVKQVTTTRYSHKPDASHSSFTNRSANKEDGTPPPIYRTLPPPPPPPESSLPSMPPQPPTPPTSMTKHKHKRSMSRSTITHISIPPTTFDIPPIPSSRDPDSADRRDSLTATPNTTARDSHGRRQPSTPSLSELLAPELQLPRLMIVATTFTPARDDEILVKVGETLRLLEEYGDGWCSVQRVGRQDAEKGVMPRFCLKERPKVLSPPRLISTFSFHGARQK